MTVYILPPPFILWDAFLGQNCDGAPTSKADNTSNALIHSRHDFKRKFIFYLFICLSFVVVVFLEIAQFLLADQHKIYLKKKSSMIFLFFFSFTQNFFLVFLVHPIFLSSCPRRTRQFSLSFLLFLFPFSNVFVLGKLPLEKLIKN